MGITQGKIRVNTYPEEPGRTLYSFHCPGCGFAHTINSTWGFNGDYEKPTFTPSILVTGGADNRRCHSFVTEGAIHFLEDSNHELAGRTVELPEWSE